MFVLLQAISAIIETIFMEDWHGVVFVVDFFIVVRLIVLSGTTDPCIMHVV